MHHRPPDTAAPPADPPRTMLCPSCGYDLRATAGDRCSECGFVFDRAALARSAFPWAHRAEMGRLRAFVKTVWVVTSDSEILRYEAAKSGIPRDAAVFRRVLSLILAACFAGIVVMLVGGGAVADAAVDRSSQRLQRPGRWAGPAQDLLVPWSAGITLRPALFAYAAALAHYAAGANRPVFRTRGLSPDYAATVESIGAYAAAPLAFFLPATAGYAAVYNLDMLDEFGPRPGLLAPVLLIATALFFLLAVGSTVHRTGQWRARTAHAGYATGFAAMGELLLRWAAGSAMILGVVPWCVGFAWIVFDSFRH